MNFAIVMMMCELPDWFTHDFVFRILESKIFSAISWGGAAVVAILGFIAKRKYRDKNLKSLLEGYVERATKTVGKERTSVKAVIGKAIDKARGLGTTRGVGAVQFRTSDVFENAARFFAQSQGGIAINLLLSEAQRCETAIGYANHQVQAARERAATAYLEIGSMLREQGDGLKALDAFRDMLRVNPDDLDALRMLGVQCRELKQYEDAER